MDEKQLQSSDPERPLPSLPSGGDRWRCNSLWSCWYGLLVCCLHAGLAYRALTAYSSYLQLPWQTAPLELTAYLGLVAGSLALAPFFLAASLLRVGNRANDGESFGSPHVRGAALPSPQPGALKNMWRHGPPTAAVLHVLMAALLCVAELVMEARLIGNGFLPPDMVWRTELDCFLDLSSRVLPLKFTSSAPTLNITPLATPSPPGLVLDPETGYLHRQEPLPVSPEYLHLAFALIVMAVRYASVFWNCQRWLAGAFSAQLFLNGAHLLVQWCGFSVLYKCQVYGGGALLQLPQPLILTAPLTALLFAIASLLVLLSSATVFLYALQKLSAFVVTHQRHLPELAEARCRLWGYFAHSAALCLLLAIGIADGPLLYDLSALYRASLDPASLVAVIGAIAHHLCWVLLWLALTLKQRWQFRLSVVAGIVQVPEAPELQLVHHAQLKRQKNISSCRDGSDAGPLLVVGGSGAFVVSETMAQNLILGVATRRCGPSRPVQMSPLRRPESTRSAALRQRAEEEEEERYVQLPRHAQQRRSRVTFERGTYQPVPTEERRQPEHGSGNYHQVAEEEGDYASLYRSRQQLRRAAAAGCDAQGREPLLPVRYAIRPPPESIYATRPQMPPPPLRRANSHETLPRGSDGLRRTLSFRGPRIDGARVATEPKEVAFDLRTTVIGEPLTSIPMTSLDFRRDRQRIGGLMTSPSSAFSPPSSSPSPVTALNHLPPPPASLLYDHAEAVRHSPLLDTPPPPPPASLRRFEEPAPPPPSQLSPMSQLQEMPRLTSPPRSLGVIHQLGGGVGMTGVTSCGEAHQRDSANFSMSVSSGSDSGVSS